MKISNLDAWICETESIPQLTRESLLKIQLKKLNLLLESKNQKKLDSLDELSTLPFTTAQMLSDSPGHFLRTSQSNVSRVISGATSGTTGPSKRVFYTKQDTDYTISFFRAGISEMLHPKESVLIQFPFSGAFGLGDLIEQAVLSIGAYSIRPCKENLFEKQCIYIKERQPTCYIGASVFLLSLIRYYHFLFPKDNFPIKRALVSGDACPTGVVLELENILESKLFPHYGSRECGLGGAITCPAHEGMHLRENHIIAEIVDENLNPVPRGIWGELVITTIGLEAMPLIRYRTGDYTRILPDACPCGSVTIRLDKISRLNDSKLTQNKFMQNKLTQEMLDSQLFAIPELIDYQASIENNTLTIDAIVLDETCKEDFVKALSSCCVDYDICVNVTESTSEDIPFYSGKRYILYHSIADK